ncbi:class I SAM-dependent methyltransferase [Pseudomonas aeruginosa]|uniref:methyltransferase domain-containing protein n=1 Tax=Pseudomonas aeruginosa TaxID=287 RepID=UPI000FD4B4A5|nr:methyltransferase domain-containing protein [Pseudomonas aeruginosa]MBA5069806.1 methyltransferase domain-containing protein [Pseudomonas aeruginosa]MCO3804689.1 class I SAM-dependent methyltransferase [Pseudomonas aeruginosa]RUJ65371.1 methyltransferase domain-containing protein [Pseudomonas aeruginosa]HDY5292349.1 methyltransferase domain-containing protein [Pseudomonas aeruginosa]HEP8420912.1 methyltransferase domain-containing protein [Pseudomonas aeruginosa]
MTASLPHGLTDCLLWSDELGMGFHPRPPMDYSGPYFEKYQALDATPMGAALTAARVDMVQRHFDGEVLDVGIGGGRFVIESGGKGFDVNEEAVQWLKSRNAYADPYKGVAAITCWDSLEHVPDPEALVRSVGEWVFVSMPVYKDQADCLKSKHFKPGEHLHYWSVRGLIGWFAKMNFGCVEINERESDLGREGITSFAFRRFHG